MSCGSGLGGGALGRRSGAATRTLGTRTPVAACSFFSFFGSELGAKLLFGFFGLAELLISGAGGGGGAAGGGSGVFLALTGVLRFVPSLLPAGLPRLFGAIVGGFSAFIDVFWAIIAAFSELSGFMGALSPDKSPDKGTTSMVVIYCCPFFSETTAKTCRIHSRSSEFLVPYGVCRFLH